MPQFQFRLASVLRPRETTRDERRGQLAEALRLLAEAEGRLAELRGEAARTKGLAQSAAGPGVVNVDRLLEAQRYEIALRLEQQRVEQQLRTIADEAERRRLTLVEADREVRVLERLRATQRERHERDDRRREERWLDEAACRPFLAEETLGIQRLIIYPELGLITRLHLGSAGERSSRLTMGRNADLVNRTPVS